MAEEKDTKKLPTVDFKGLEIFAVGKWNGDTYEQKDLQAMVSAFAKVGFKPTVKAGHPDGQDDEKKAREVFGAPALGYVSRIYIKGKKLFADLMSVPKRFADLIKAGSYRRVSAEIYWNYTDDSNGSKFPRVLKAISFLGADIPALTDLKEIENLFQTADSGALFAYDDNGHEFRLYELPHNYLGEVSSGYNTDFPRKSKEWSKYRPADVGSAESCVTCRFFLPMYNACTVVEGLIEPNFTSDLYEPLLRRFDAAEDTFENFAADVKTYIIRKIGDEYCLISKTTGKQLGCHPTKEEAIEQERAIRANTESDQLAMDYVTLQDSAKGILMVMGRLKGESTLTLQSVIFDTERWTAAKAKSWLSDHDLKSGKVDEPAAGKSIRFRQREPGEFQPGSFRNIEPGNNSKKGEKSQGGDEMDEKEIEELKAKEAEAQKALKSQKDDHSKEVGDLRKEYEQRLADSEKRIQEQADKEKTEMTARMASLEDERRDERRNSWIAQLKKDGKLLPVEEEKVRQVYARLALDSTVCKYAGKDGKEIDEPVLDTFKSIFAGRSATLFKELTPQDDHEDKREPDPDPGVESSRKAKEYLDKNKDATMQQAYAAVWKEDPALYQRYNEARQH